MPSPRALLLTTGLVVAAAVPAPALAAPDWVVPQTLPGPGASANATSLGVDADGRATYGALLVRGVRPFDTQVRLLGHLPGDPLVEQFGRDSVPGGEVPGSIQVAVGANGAAAACVATILGPDPSTFPVRYDVAYRAPGSSTWEPMTTLVTNTVKSGYYNPCQPVVGADGTAVVVTRRTTFDGEPRRSQVFLTVHRPDAAWTAPQAVSAANSTGYGHVAGVDDAGNVTVAWDERYAGNNTATASDDLSTVKVATRAASNGILGAPSALTASNGTNSADTPFLGVGPDGTAVLAFEYDLSSVWETWAAVRAGAGGAWGSPHQLVSNVTANSAPRDAGVAPNGTAYVAYWRQANVDSDNQLGLQRIPAGGNWSGDTGAGPMGLHLSTAGLAFIGNDAVCVYEGVIGAPGGPQTDVVQAVRWRAATATPDGERDLLPANTPAQLDQVDTDHQGGVFAVIGRADLDPFGTSQAIAYDASPPRLVKLDVPATAVAGTAVGMSASFADRWSSLGATSWSFGDGATATGDATSHAYAAPGTYTVSVRGVDALGNDRVATAQVVIAAANGSSGPPAGRGGDIIAPIVKLTPPSCPRKLSAKACVKRRASRALWRTLRGTVTDTGGSGVARVEIAVARRAGKRLLVLKRKKFSKGTTSTFAKATVKATMKGSAWSLQLPRLARGTYLLRIRAVDRAGNASSLLTRTLRLR